MRKFSSLAIAAIVAAALVAGTATAAERTFKVSHVFNTTHPVHNGLLKAKELLLEKSGGKFDLQIYPAGTYANYKDAIKAVKMGVLDFCPLDTAIDYYPESGVLLSPYTFRDYDHWRAFKKSDVYTDLLATIGEKVGVKQLSLYTFGFRHATTKSVKATTPEAFADLKLRVVNFPPYPEAATVLNAHGTPLPIGDVYMALKTGVADGQENPNMNAATMKFHEVQKYLTVINYMWNPEPFVVNKAWLEGLDPSLQKIVQDAAWLYTETQNKLRADSDAYYLDMMRKSGIEVYTPSQEERALFREACASVYSYFIDKKQFTQEEFDEFRKLASGR